MIDASGMVDRHQIEKIQQFRNNPDLGGQGLTDGFEWFRMVTNGTRTKARGQRTAPRGPQVVPGPQGSNVVVARHDCRVACSEQD